MTKKRNIAVSVILSLVTCGIYGLYWFVKLTDETNSATNYSGTSGLMAVLFTILTCGIYGFYWAYKMGEKVDLLKQKNGNPNGSSAILFLILQIFGLGIVNYCLVQSELNKS